MASIGPFWNGNEVWLIAAGGALFALFPEAYASSFSGFYLAFIIVLWLLMFRGVAMELRDHFPASLASVLGCVFLRFEPAADLLYGVALGNLLHGVPLDPQGYFQGTLRVFAQSLRALVGVFAIERLMLHGATFTCVMRTRGRRPNARGAWCRGCGRWCWYFMSR